MVLDFNFFFFIPSLEYGVVECRKKMKGCHWYKKIIILLLSIVSYCIEPVKSFSTISIQCLQLPKQYSYTQPLYNRFGREDDDDAPFLSNVISDITSIWSQQISINDDPNKKIRVMIPIILASINSMLLSTSLETCGILNASFAIFWYIGHLNDIEDDIYNDEDEIDYDENDIVDGIALVGSIVTAGLLSSQGFVSTNISNQNIGIGVGTLAILTAIGSIVTTVIPTSNNDKKLEEEQQQRQQDEYLPKSLQEKEQEILDSWDEKFRESQN